jgi:predicted amidophosphoribosyltransferase
MPQLLFPFAHALLSPRCLGCRRRLPADQNAFCRSCVRYFLGAPSLKGALFEHRGPGRGFLHALRETAPERAAGWALALLRRRGHLESWRGEGVELVVNAPQRVGGRSGLAVVAERVAQEIGAQFVPRAFRKSSRRTQHGKAAEARMDTPPFLELTLPDDLVRGREVLVLDDVNTTGTTLDLCAWRLREAGASRVRRFALAERPAQYASLRP